MGRVSDYTVDYDKNIHQKNIDGFAKRKYKEEDKKKKKPLKQNKDTNDKNSNKVAIETQEEKENWKSI